MLEKFLPRQDFSSYEDFIANYQVNVPPRFNFAYDVVDGWTREEPEKPALAWMNGALEERIVTFREVTERSNQAANLFKAHGIRKGDRVLLILKQRIEVWICMIALHKIGAVVIPASFLGGAVFCMICDLIARTAFAPTELNISTVTSIFGAPVVIFMLTRRK